MPRFDAQIEVLCDGCGVNDFWWPAYVYSSQFDRVGFYATGDADFLKWCRSEGWTKSDEKTFCPDCSEAAQ